MKAYLPNYFLGLVLILLFCCCGGKGGNSYPSVHQRAVAEQPSYYQLQKLEEEKSIRELQEKLRKIDTKKLEEISYEIRRAKLEATNTNISSTSSQKPFSVDWEKEVPSFKKIENSHRIFDIPPVRNNATTENNFSSSSSHSSVYYRERPESNYNYSTTYSNTNSSHVDVSGYYRKDGTYVEPYTRTAPNATIKDNFSFKGNINPYTGKIGTKSKN